MTDKVLRFGLVGAGLVAPFHAKGIKATKGCELAGVADVDAARAKKLGDEYKCRVYASMEEMLADKAVDGVHILTPNHLHLDATLKAAAAGKHVLVEKPPSMSLADTDRMIAACKKAGVKLGVTLQCRIRKPIQAMKKALAEGRFGQVFQADAYMKWFRASNYYHMDAWRSSRRSGAGVTIQHAFHYIDLLHYLMGGVAAVSARMTNNAHKDVELEDTLLAAIKYANGAQGVVVASTAFWPGTDIRIEVNGENGTAIMSGEKMDTWKFKDERPEDEQIRQFGRGSVGTAATGPAAFDFADHQVVIEGMARAIREGVEPLITAESARGTLEIALAMYQSAASGKDVTLPISDEAEIWSK